MLKWILGIAAGVLWCAVVFVATWWLTFPSQAVVDRAAFEVQKASKGSYALKATSASPWWTGLALYGVTLYAIDDGGSAAPVLMADSVSARTSLLSVIGGGLPVYGVVDMAGNPIRIDAELDRSASPPRLTNIDADARELGVDAIAKMLRPLGADVSGTGKIDIIVDAEVGEDVDGHDGRMKIKGDTITLDLTLPDPLSGGDFIIEDMKVSEIDLVLDVKDGKAELKRGRISSDRADIDIDLDVNLNKNFQRSRLTGTMVLSNLGGELKTFEAAFSAAKWSDGKYHYRISCRIERLSASCIKPERQSRGATRAAPVPSAEDIRARIEQQQDRPTATPEDRASAVNTNRRRPSANRDLPIDRDGDDEDEPLDDDEMEEDEEPLDDDDPNHNEVPVELDVLEPPPGAELPSPNDIPGALLPPR